MVWSARQPAELPLVLVGPMLRRVDPQSVTVFLACKEARTVTLRVYEGDADGTGTTVTATGTRETVKLGTHLHVVAVTASASTPLTSGRLYRYQVFLGPTGGAEVPESGTNLYSAGIVAPSAAAARAALTFDSAGAPTLPSFATPPADPSTLRLLHGSCRKPHGGGHDMLPVVADLIAPDAADATSRPHQLLLTGDQIYADDVADPMLAMAKHATAALGLPAEVLPAKKAVALLEDRYAEVGQRQHAVLEIARFTSDAAASHLFTFAEFVGMYLLVWSDVLWPATLPDFGDEFPHLRREMGEETYAQTLAGESYPAMIVPAPVKRMQRWVAGAKPLDDFRDALPAVRRALANVPTLMMFDDHEVTDDWLLNQQWCTDSVITKDENTGSRLGRRIAANGMAACAVFQAWGNTPDRFAASGPAGEKGRALLTALATWTGANDDASFTLAEEIAQRVGTPVELGDAPKDPEPTPQGRARGKLLKRHETALDYHYDVRWPGYQLVVLDTRTYRGFPGGPTDPPSLIGTDAALTAMLHDVGDPAADGVVVVVSAAPVVGLPLVEDFIQPLAGRSYSGSVFTDNEAWGLQAGGLHALLPRLATATAARADGSHARRLVVLSGDVHYGYAARLRFSARAPHTAPGAPAALAGTKIETVTAQLVSSALKNEETKTHVVHYFGYEPFRSRAVEQRLVGWRNESGASVQVGHQLGLGWGGSGLRPWKVSGRPAVGELTDTTVLTTEPDQRAVITFIRHDEADPVIPPRPVEARTVQPPSSDPQQSLGQYLAAAGNHQDYLGPWGSGKELVGRVNLGEVRFTWGEGDRKWVAQTLWWRLERGADRTTVAPLTRYVVDLALGSTLFQPPRYGGYVLKAGDKDAKGEDPPTYGGVERKGYTGTAHVAALQADLIELGLTLHRAPTGEFDRYTAWAVRELQIYGGRARVARDTQPTPRPTRYLDALRAVDVPEADRYRGIVHGEVDLPTEALITTWKERQWRCPVVVEGWTTAGGQRVALVTIPASGSTPSRPAENLWRHDECPVDSAVFYVTDFSDLADGAAAGAPRLLSGYDSHEEVDGFGGPRRDPSSGHRSAHLEVRPETLLPRVSAGAAGPTLAALVSDRGSADQAVADLATQRVSTFKVLRALSEVRADGQYDAVRADGPPASAFGLAGWNSGAPVSPPQLEGPKPLREWGVAPGDLMALVALLRRTDPDAFEAVFGRYGLSAAKAWGKDGKALLDDTRRVLSAAPALTDRSGEAKALGTVGTQDLLRTWHWVDRLTRGVAEQDGVRRAMWLLGRQRLADLLGAPWDGPKGTTSVPDLPDGVNDKGEPKTRRARIADLVTSERAVALLLTWHHRAPAGVVGPGPDTEVKDDRAKPRAGAQLHAALAAATASGAADFALPTSQWDDAHEDALTTALLDQTQGDAGLHAQLVEALAWPTWTPSGGAPTQTNPRAFALPIDVLPAAERTLLATRGSFRFDNSQLPRGMA